MSEEANTNSTVNETNSTVGAAPAVKWACILAYVLFFLPLVVEGNKEVHRYHANQGLVLLIFSVGFGIIGSIIPILGWFIILPVGEIFCLVCLVMGMINAGNDQMKPLPLIGKITILK